MNKKIFALALGTFCLGMAEYVMMSILPEVAQSLKISISDAGQLISSYAIGVGVGAPLVMVFARNYP